MNRKLSTHKKLFLIILNHYSKKIHGNDDKKFIFKNQEISLNLDIFKFNL